VMDIPMDTSKSDDDRSYLVQFDDATTVSIPVADMPSLVPAPSVSLQSEDTSDSLLPPFLQLKKNTTYEHEGQYYKQR